MLLEFIYLFIYFYGALTSGQESSDTDTQHNIMYGQQIGSRWLLLTNVADNAEEILFWNQ